MSVGVTAEVKSKLSVVDVVGESVTLKKAGTTYKGLCPFHGEKTPSFVVTPGRESWHCFGCGKGGDIFSFVMERDGMSFPEALRTLAAKAGVEIDERTKREDARKARLRGVLDTAIAFYHAVLTASKPGEPALAYLRGRGFTDETIEAYQLGWAPAGWDVMARQLQAKRNVDPNDLVEVGLASPSQRGSGVIDKFRARVLFPIRDQNGHAVGLGGRLLEGEGPKYLNSPATPLFDKSRTLYLIDKAKGPIRKTEQAVIVEGYTDALMAHQAGFENVVASLGTALTPNQKVHGIVHTAATAAAAVGAGLAQLPGSDGPVLAGIQTTMIIAIAHEHSAQITKAAAADLLLTFTATHVGRGISQWLVGWVPGWGNAINASTAAALTEAVGWAADAYFGEQRAAA